ncbi:phosphoserine phosphatase SerB [Craterilacuibacter sp.]|uniref:phosphoserine phosphatase SerB n=1 Tax=Craterilacuibacter sp. TaxID=2870909 RepID=UPI003F34D7EB
MPSHLVVQAPSLSDHALLQLAAIAGAKHIERTSATHARLSTVLPETRNVLMDMALRLEVDAALVEDGTRFADYGLLVSDMDSTLITIECIDEIADMLGIKPQVAAITERSMQGELDFAQSLTQRVALLEGLEEAALERVYRERLRLTRGAETLLAACKAHGVRFMLVSGGFTFFTERLKTELGLDYAYANELEIVDGRLTGRIKGEIVDAAAKRRLLIAKREELGLRPEQVIAMGDGANDLLMLAEAGIGIAFDAKPVVRAQADIAINHVGLEGVAALFVQDSADVIA